MPATNSSILRRARPNSAVLAAETLRQMIENGEHEKLKDFLSEEKTMLLEQTYGGIHGALDSSGLYPGTSPLLHAALRGQAATFVVVVDALKVIFSGIVSVSINWIQ